MQLDSGIPSHLFFLSKENPFLSYQWQPDKFELPTLMLAVLSALDVAIQCGLPWYGICVLVSLTFLAIW